MDRDTNLQNMTFLGKIMPACNKATFEAQFIKKLSKTVAELKKYIFYTTSVYFKGKLSNIRSSYFF